MPRPFSLPSPAARAAVLCAVLLAACAAPAYAQQARGDFEIQFSGSLNSEVGEDASSTTGLIQAKAGYFLSDRVEVGAFPSLLITTSEAPQGGRMEQDTEVTVGMGAFAVYSFLSEDAVTVPYVGGQYYRSDLSDPDLPAWLGVNGGVKVFVNRYVAFDVGGNYLWRLESGGGSQLLLFQVGLSFLL